MNWTTKNAIKLSKKVSKPERSSRNMPLDIKQSLFPGLPELKNPEPLSPILQSKTISLSSSNSSPVRVSLGSDQEALYVTIEPGQKSKQPSTSPISPVAPLEGLENASSRGQILNVPGFGINKDLVDKIEDIETQLHITISDAFDQIRELLKSHTKPVKCNDRPVKEIQCVPDYSELGHEDYNLRPTSELGFDHEEMDETAINIVIESSDESVESFDVGESFFQ